MWSRPPIAPLPIKIAPKGAIPPTLRSTDLVEQYFGIFISVFNIWRQMHAWQYSHANKSLHVILQPFHVLCCDNLTAANIARGIPLTHAHLFLVHWGEAKYYGRNDFWSSLKKNPTFYAILIGFCWYEGKERHHDLYGISWSWTVNQK